MENALLGVGVVSVISSVFYRKTRRSTCSQAVCVFDGSSGIIKGTVEMFAKGHKTEFVCNLTGLSLGLHGFHVHRCGDLRMGCDSACDHYNPEKRLHGGRDGHDRHKGDLGNITGTQSGVCTDRLLADVNLDDIIGRALVVHADEDDLGKGGDDESKKTGNAGKRIGCGIIGRVN